MPKSDYMPLDDAGKADLFTHVAATLPTFFLALGITAATPQVSTQANDAIVFAYVCGNQQVLLAAGQQATSAKTRLRDGDPLNPNTAVSLAFPLAPANVPSPVMPGVVPRFRTFTKWIKSLTGYTPAIGEALKIIGEESTAADLATVKPNLPLRITGNRVEHDWSWDGLAGQVDALEILVDRGNGIFVLLTIDTRPGYVDTEPFPANSGKWKYKAIWRKDDQRVGLWSDVAEITVG